MTADKLKLFSVAPLPVVLENGQTAHLRRFSAGDRLAFFDFIAKGNDRDKDLRTMCDSSAMLLALTLCDESGARLFTDDDAPSLLSMDERIFQHLAAEALTINALGTDAQAAVKKK